MSVLPLRCLWTLAVTLVLTFGLMAGGAGCGPAADPAPEPGPADPPPVPAPQPIPASPPLKVGDVLPPLVAAGWVNGPPPEPGRGLLLVDLWAHWCPYCRTGAPGLVHLHRKYAGRGVAFVSLTNMTRESVEAFVKQFSIPWPNGYGATPETVTALGAGSGMAMGAYGVAPTVYLVDPDGRVRWTDDRGRYTHRDIARWGKEMEAAIEAALADSGPEPKGPKR